MSSLTTFPHVSESPPPALAAIKTPVRAIRAKCLDCSGDSSHEVKFCPITDCALYAYRMGRSPNRTRKPVTDFQKEELRARLQAGREKKLSLRVSEAVATKTAISEVQP